MSAPLESLVAAPSARVLVVDDDPDVRESLSRVLEHAGYTVSTANDGLEAMEILTRTPFDLILLDVMMPRMDGLEVCQRARARGLNAAILIMTAKDVIDDRVDGLDAGADDYVVKPFALKELLARVRALLRRTVQEQGPVLSYADLSLNMSSRIVTRRGRRIELTRTEFAILQTLLENAEIVLGYDTIMNLVWEYSDGSSLNTLQVFMGYLRRKLEEGGYPRLIHTVREVGYVLRMNP